MFEFRERPRLGAFVITRDLGRCAVGERWLALHHDLQTSHVAYRLPERRTPAEQALFKDCVQRIASFRHPHVLGIEQFGIGSDHAGIVGPTTPWIVTPFRGDADGLRTLARLARDKGGHLPLTETLTAVEQLLSAVEFTHGAALPSNGPLALEQILVDQRGSVLIELYGVERSLRGGGHAAPAEVQREEIRSVVEIAYELITGLKAEEPVIPAARLVKRLDPAWARWLQRGLDPAGGFESVEVARRTLLGGLDRVPAQRDFASRRGQIARLWSRVSPGVGP